MTSQSRLSGDGSGNSLPLIKHLPRYVWELFPFHRREQEDYIIHSSLHSYEEGEPTLNTDNWVSKAHSLNHDVGYRKESIEPERRVPHPRQVEPNKEMFEK